MKKVGLLYIYILTLGTKSLNVNFFLQFHHLNAFQIYFATLHFSYNKSNHSTFDEFNVHHQYLSIHCRKRLSQGT